ncbi:MAG: NERD domain-containing protein [Armatimonadota bacterium]|nr:NERD domain-containing protein [Armatimonadota bacterium]
MIIKELDPFTSEDPLLKAGRTAEEQMAFYLRRAFGDDPYILVFNSLRLEADGDAAQIDHLILHRHGMIIIESKSVTSRVQINNRGEWIRWHDRVPRGMASRFFRQSDNGTSYGCTSRITPNSSAARYC